MRRGWKAILLFLLLIEIAAAQVASPAPKGNASHSFRDAATGDLWVMQRDKEHPGGPGRLAMVKGSAETEILDMTRKREWIIRAGDHVVIHEKTARVTARLDGVAQTAAARGERVNVKLSAVGWLVRAVAVAPGQAQFMEVVR